jgi:hypothetical protein
MEVLDFSKYFPKKREFVQLNNFAPQFPFNLIAVGPTGSGKTNSIVDLIVSKLYFDDLFIIAGDLQDDYYIFLEEYINSLPKKSNKNIYLTDDINFDADNLDREKQNIVIVDDKITEKDQSSIEDLFTRIRKLGGSIIYISQSYYDIPKIIRDNTHYVYLFKLKNTDTAYRILKNYCCGFLEEAKTVYHDIHRDKFNFMMIDDKDNNIRKNYNIIDIDNL